jgi:hypothetical protein
MRARHWSALGLGLALAASSASADEASPDAARTKALLAYQHDLVSVLAPRADAMPLLGAALLARPLPKQPKYNDFHTLIQRAAQATDSTPAVQWARLVDCDAKAGTCPNADALQALTETAADNAAVWLIKLGADTANGKNEAARDDLHRAASARLYDDYTGTALKALASTAGTLPAPADAIDPATAAGPHGVRWCWSTAWPAVAATAAGHAAAARMRRRQGRRYRHGRRLQLAKVLEWGSSPLSRSLGLHLRETLADGPAEQAAARTERANLTWQVQNFARLSDRAPQDKALAQHLLALARNGGTEMSLVLAALRDAGIPADAPGSAAAGTGAGAPPAQ